jgi:uncharacterized protein (TIGR02421 family)
MYDARRRLWFGPQQTSSRTMIFQTDSPSTFPSLWRVNSNELAAARPESKILCQARGDLNRLEAQYLRWLAKLDREIVAAARDVKVLSQLSWPVETQRRFLGEAARGNLALPRPEYRCAELSDNRQALARVMAELAGDDEPLRRYLHDTAESYHTLCLLLESVGTPQFTAHSQALYGAPTDHISSGHVTNLEAAEHFIDVSRQYRLETSLHESDYCLSAQQLAQEMQPRLDDVFGPGVVRVDIDPHMASKAAAGATRIRLRAGTCFSEYDLGQLLQHEGFVHSLTAINGKRQTHIQSFGLGAPRTTGSQEGLATFAELVTGVMDINRVERLALRVIAIDRVLNGADFVDTYRFFLETGQSDMESFNSAMRIFRGVPTDGRAAFCKDVVYLHGLMEVHTFFRWAMQHRKLAMTRHFFAGRMTVSDVVRLGDLFDEGILDAPQFLPPWMVRTNGLAAYLAFSVFANRITISDLDENHPFERVTDLGL